MRRPAPARTGSSRRQPPQLPSSRGESVVQARDGKHVIPYQVLAQERERAIRAEQMVRDLTAKLELDRAAAQQGKVGRSVPDRRRAAAPAAAREAPDVARRMDNLIDLAKSLSEQVEAGRPAAEQAESSRREQQVQALVSVEDTIQANPKLAHLRATDPAAFNDLADIDTMLRDRAAWKTSRSPSGSMRQSECTKPPTARSSCPARPPAAPAQPADQAARVAQAVAKAQAEASGPSTLSDIPAASRPPIPRARPCWLCRAAP